jgi:hypothetical protein
MKKLIKYITYKLYNFRQEYKRSAQADNLCSFIWDYQQYLRGLNKYGPPTDIDEIYQKWFDMLDENGINLDEIYS